MDVVAAEESFLRELDHSDASLVFGGEAVDLAAFTEVDPYLGQRRLVQIRHALQQLVVGQVPQSDAAIFMTRKQQARGLVDVDAGDTTLALQRVHLRLGLQVKHPNEPLRVADVEVVLDHAYTAGDAVPLRCSLVQSTCDDWILLEHHDLALNIEEFVVEAKDLLR